MKAFAIADTVRTSCGAEFNVKELKALAKSRSIACCEQFFLCETPDEQYVKLTIAEAGKAEASAELLSSQRFFQLLVQLNVELL
ncbi:MAG: hypothetical protein LPJ89_02000 [Hymenobacteraceae bacterium]|nr:hypothetical protein [Hymenobacteraceae bacterium]MDX5396107.1 hypothetical protein [Hymenobacteraceae bacterium]MDX5442536.1 hypothetical protein [Hymenobacteraceae bacterium]MDX5512172.1 hypothetical protein [Hymenobacteraceae bacterium]